MVIAARENHFSLLTKSTPKKHKIKLLQRILWSIRKSDLEISSVHSEGQGGGFLREGTWVGSGRMDEI